MQLQEGGLIEPDTGSTRWDLVGRAIESIVSGLHASTISACLEDVSRNVLSVFKADGCLIYLAEPEADELYVAAAAGSTLRIQQDLCLPFGKGLAGRVAESGDAQHVSSNERYLELLGEVAEGELKEVTITSAIAIPMMAFGELLGVLEVFSQDPERVYGESDLEALKPLANLAALAVPKSGAQESLAKLAEICIRFLEEKDPYTHGHSLRVMRYSVALAGEIGLSFREQEELRLCALLHDIGKVIIKDSILNKPGKLTKAEWQWIKMHPTIGSNIASNISRRLALKILAHHERWDGKGYPNGLVGEQIPLVSRIIGLVDAVDAITSKRAYREKATLAEAIDEVKRHRATQFDPALVDALVRMYEEGRFALVQV